MATDAETAVRSSTPPLLSSGVALLAALGTVLVVAVSTPSIVAGTVGTIVIGLAFVRRSSRLITIGTTSLFAGVVVAGMVGTAPEFLLVGAFLTAMAWDAGWMALAIVEEVGSDVSTLRVESVRLLSSSVVLAAGAGLGYVVFRRSVGEPPPLALVALLIGVTAILAALEGS